MRIVPQSVPASYSQFPALLALPAPRIAGLLTATIPDRAPPKTTPPEPTASDLDVATAAFRAVLSRASEGEATLADVIQAALDAHQTVMHSKRPLETVPMRPPQPDQPLLAPHGKVFDYAALFDPSAPGMRSVDEMNAELLAKHGDTLRYLHNIWRARQGRQHG